MARTALAVVDIPDTSVLSHVVGKGREGPCLACGEPLHAHFGHKGAWIGCKGKHLPNNALFIMVPQVPSTGLVLARGHAPIATTLTRLAAGVQKSDVEKVKVKVVSAKGKAKGIIVPRVSYVYAVKDRRLKPAELTPAFAKVYKALVKAKKPLTVQVLATKCKRPLEATRFTLNRLVEAKLATRVPLTD